MRFANRRTSICFDLGTARGIRDFVFGHASYIDLKVFRSGPASARGVIFFFILKRLALLG